MTPEHESFSGQEGVIVKTILVGEETVLVLTARSLHNLQACAQGIFMNFRERLLGTSVEPFSLPKEGCDEDVSTPGHIPGEDTVGAL